MASDAGWSPIQREVDLLANHLVTRPVVRLATLAGLLLNQMKKAQGDEILVTKRQMLAWVKQVCSKIYVQTCHD
jgi:hypothetical protein